MKKLIGLALAAVMFSPFTQLQPAAYAGSLNIIEYLEAVENGNAEALQEIFAGPEREEAINYHDSHGHTPLDYLLMRANPIFAYDTLLLLIRTGMQPGSENVSPGVRLVRQLVCEGVPEQIDASALNEKLPSGVTPFMWACTLADPASIQKLIDAGADLSLTAGTDESSEFGPGENALIFAAARNKYPEVINILLKNGLDVESTSSLGMGALSVACIFNELPDAALALIRAGADVKRADGVSGTPFQYAARHAYALPLLKELAVRGADVFACDDACHTALHEAATNNPNPEVIKYLLSLGIPVNYAVTEENEEEYTPMMLAARLNPSPEVIKFMIDAGGDLNQKDNEGNAAFEGLPEERINWLKQVGLGMYVQ